MILDSFYWAYLAPSRGFAIKVSVGFLFDRARFYQSQLYHKSSFSPYLTLDENRGDTLDLLKYYSHNSHQGVPDFTPAVL